MEFYMKLPRNKKEFTLFLAVISIISVNIIAPLITCFEIGFHMYVWADVIKVIPFIWISVIALVLITYKPAEWLTSRIVEEEDSFSNKNCPLCYQFLKCDRCLSKTRMNVSEFYFLLLHISKYILEIN